MLGSVLSMGKAQAECIVGNKASYPGSKHMLYGMCPSFESIRWTGEYVYGKRFVYSLHFKLTYNLFLIRQTKILDPRVPSTVPCAERKTLRRYSFCPLRIYESIKH